MAGRLGFAITRELQPGILLLRHFQAPAKTGPQVFGEHGVEELPAELLGFFGVWRFQPADAAPRLTQAEQENLDVLVVERQDELAGGVLDAGWSVENLGPIAGLGSNRSADRSPGTTREPMPVLLH